MKYDAVIVGAGPGGVEAALRVSRLGGRAALVELGELGGVCTNRGCIPTKALAASADLHSSLTRAMEFGVDVPAYTVNREALFKRRDRVAQTMRLGVAKLLSEAKVDVVRGTGRMVSNTEVDVGGDVLEGRTIVIATGSEPAGLPGIGLDHEFVVSGDDAASMASLPGKVVIVGGGFIGCEYASIYSRLGAKVTLIEALPRILSQEDPDVSELLRKSLSKSADILTNVKVESADREAKTVKAGGVEYAADMVLLAVGRKPVLPEGLDDISVEYGKAGIVVDSMMRTSVDNVYAVGDVASPLKLAHVASAGGETAARNIMGDKRELDLTAVPWCVYTAPEVARVGITEAEAKSGVRVGRAEYTANGKARCMGEREGFCKVVVDDASDAIVGVHIIGAHASDLIGEAAAAVKAKAKAGSLADTIHPHPALCELIREACRSASR